MGATTFAAWMLIVAAVPGQAAASRRPTTVQERAVDMAALVGGERLFGMLFGPPRQGELPFVVRREWLRKHAPNVYRKTVAGEDERRRMAIEQLRDRLAAWRERRSEPKLLTSFLDRSLEETKARLAAFDAKQEPHEPAQLLLVSIPVVQIRKQYQQSPETRRILALAWEERLDDPEEASAAALVERLKEKKIEPAQAQPDLSDRLDALPLDDRQWAAKMALAEYAILGKPRYQGAGGMLVREDSGQDRPPLGELIAGMAKSQLEGALGDLLNPAGGVAKPNENKPNEAIDKATRECDAEGTTGVRITNLDQDLTRRQVTVRDAFWAKMPDGAWQAIWQASSTIDASKPRPNEEDALKQDPQVAEALKLVKSLGLDLDPDLLRTAMRSGAATQEALANVDRQFADFLLANTRRLDGPPLVVPEAAAQQQGQ
ncbi:MAG TPA: hypothetical protein VMV10_32180 [Pirellulales bacterium]|nr:hypothetical protein [Pirellulales bacterium]